jgi:hypothetical protein
MVMANQEGWTLVLNEILLNFSDFGLPMKRMLNAFWLFQLVVSMRIQGRDILIERGCSLSDWRVKSSQ